MVTYYRVLAGLAVVTVAVTAYFLYKHNQEIRNEATEKVAEEMGQYVRDRVVPLLVAEDFSGKDLKEVEPVFEKLWKTVQSPQIVRMKVWNKDAMIVWSDFHDLIGRRFSDNDEIEEAFEGEIEHEDVAELKDEQLNERQYSDLSEIYIPIFDPQNEKEVIGVIEVYRTVTALNADINRQCLILLLKVSILVLVGFSLVATFLKAFFQEREGASTTKTPHAL